MFSCGIFTSYCLFVWFWWFFVWCWWFTCIWHYVTAELQSSIVCLSSINLCGWGTRFLCGNMWKQSFLLAFTRFPGQHKLILFRRSTTYYKFHHTLTVFFKGWVPRPQKTVQFSWGVAGGGGEGKELPVGSRSPGPPPCSNSLESGTHTSQT